MDFSDIVERSRALRSMQEATASKLTDNIPHLERALPQIDYESRRLAASQQQAPQTSSMNAMRLLSEYGYETDKLERTLQSVALLDAFEPMQPVLDTDLQSYLDSSNELVVAAAIDSAVRRSKSHSLASLASSIDAEWDVVKRDLLAVPSTHPLPTPTSSVRIAPAGAITPSPFSAFASPFRQPRAARVSTAAGTHLPIMASAVGVAGIPSARARLTSRSPPPSIYHDIVRRVVMSGTRPVNATSAGTSSDVTTPAIPQTPFVTSSSGPVRIATEFDDCLLAHHAPRGDASVAAKSVQHLHAVFNALRYITGEFVHTSPADAKSNGFDKSNLDASKTPSRFPFSSSSPSSADALAHQVCRGAHRFLCLQFREDKMRREIEARPVEARRGGKPGVRADVRAYLNLIFDRGVPEDLAEEGPMFDGMPVWAFVYYFLRAGFSEEALCLVDDAIAQGAMHNSLVVFANALRAYVESGPRRTIPAAVLSALVAEFGVSVKRGPDPYERACYVVIARLDPNAGDKLALPDSDYSLLFYSIEDYLWLRLSIARIPSVDGGSSQGDDDALPEALSAYALPFAHVGEEMKQYGPAHFNAQGDTPTFYALVLLLTAQLNEAVTYLEAKARALSEATHIAIVLYYYGMIRDSGKAVPNVVKFGGGGGSNATAAAVVSRRRRGNVTGNEHGTEEHNNQTVVDYAGLMWRYASRTCMSDPGVAATYIFTIEDAPMCRELLKKLVLECKGDERLVGRHGNGGVLAEMWARKSSVSGVSKNDRTDNTDNNSNNHNEGQGPHDMVDGMDGWRSVVVDAGDEAERKGDRDVALRLYDIAGVRARMMDIHLSRVSGELVNATSGTRVRVLEEARRYLDAVRDCGSNSETMMMERSIGSLEVLLEMAHLFDLHWDGREGEAVKQLDRLNLIPNDDTQVVSAVPQLTYGSAVWTEHVVERVPDVLVAGMEAIAAVYAQGKGGGSEEERTRLRKWARCIVNVSGMMPNLSADMSARLVSLEVIMN